MPHFRPYHTIDRPATPVWSDLDIASHSTTAPRETIDVPRLSPLACPKCGVIDHPTLAPGTLVHYARLLCPGCGLFLRWCRWPRDAQGKKVRRPSFLDPHNVIAEIRP